MGLHTMTAVLDVTDAELAMIDATAKAYGKRREEFLGRCLARGLLVVVQELQDARAGLPLAPLAEEPISEEKDDIPF